MRSVLITGGSRGIGLAIARRLAAGGTRVIAVARTQSEELHAAMQAAEAQAPGSLHFRAFDLSQVDAIPDFVRETRRQFGELWGLVNNAGIGTGGVLATMHNSQIEMLLRLNLQAPMLLTKYVSRAMMAAGEGRIVNVSSITASTGFNGLSVYSATKAGLIGFTRSLAREVGRAGVTVNAVAPGFLETEMTSDMGGEELQRIVRRSALRRLAEVDDVAAAVEFLLGDGAKNITGTVMTVDAGNTA